MMPKWLWPIVGAAAIIGVAIALSLYRPTPGTSPQSTTKITQVQAGAFGSLADAMPVQTGERTDALKQAAAPTTTGSAGSGTTTILPVPPIQATRYEYVYDGPLTIPDLPVLKRIPSLSFSHTSSLIDGLGIKADAFQQLKLQQATIVEDQATGISLSVDYVNGSISLFRQIKNGGPVPLLKSLPAQPESTNTLEPTARPSDAALISASNQFLTKYGISRAGLGSPELVNQSSIYATEPGVVMDVFRSPDATVVYPWQENNQHVYDQSGNPYGLTVNLALPDLTVNSVYPIVAQHWQSSAYSLETNTDRIRTIVRRGGLYSYQPDPSEDVTTTTITLGAPTTGYLISQYQLESRNTDYLVPALIFPVTKGPTDGSYYPTAITIPLVKEILDQADQVNPKILPVDGETTAPSDSGSAPARQP